MITHVITYSTVSNVSGVAANVRFVIPFLSDAGVKSAIMTTVVSTNNLETPIAPDQGDSTTPYDVGAVILQPTRALRPGLIYETTGEEFLHFLCCHRYNTTTVKSISRTAARSFRCPAGGANHDHISSLNYHSISVRLSQMRGGGPSPGA
ncbi:unnamed protein product [Linum trigynum]|uniref:Uncharacterized protein n=1 Tax=Linum trigynum TaxID=586398 RepID=A0AAV2CGL6_9ROSI